MVKIIRLEDGKIFSRNEANKLFGYINRYKIENNSKAQGYHWAFFKENIDIELLLNNAKLKDIENKYNQHSESSKKILCLITLKVYKSISEAASKTNITKYFILKSIKTGKEIDGHIFKFI